MKFLCLHGSGANSHIMETQTAALRHSLGDGHTYEFVEAVREAPMAEGLDAFSTADTPFFAFYDPQDLNTLQTAITQLDHYMVQEGPFDVIMGVSEGAVLAAVYLLKHAEHPHAVKAAVFLSSAASMHEFEYMDIAQSEACIDIPTAHIWGSQDDRAPTGGQVIAARCEPKKCLTFVHDGGHEIPRKEALTKTVHIIRRMLQSID